MPCMTATNLAQIILAHAETKPDLPALIIPSKWDEDGIHAVDQVTFRELATLVAKLRGGLANAGFKEGDRVVVMFPVSIDLYVLVLALLASGMVAVFVDSGMGRKRVFEALELSKAKAIVSVDPLLKLWPMLKVLRGKKRYSVDRKRIGVGTLFDLGSAEPSQDPIFAPKPNVSALMTFTSGSTGSPKAANRVHDILVAQHHALSEEFPEAEGEIDMPCFPVVPLHNLACGITTVMPAVDLRAPATVNPGLVIDQVAEFGVTRMTGAPAYLTRLADEMEARGSGLQTIKTLGAGGAPVPKALCQRLVDAMPNARLLVIYGSTEAEPMAHVTMQDVVAADGDGYLVGIESEAATLALVELPEEPVTLDETEIDPYRVPTGEVGEVVVRGGHVLRAYVDNPQADAETKIKAPDGGVWHRTGDMGRWDEQGRLWLVGRLKDRVRIDGKLVDPFTLEVVIDEVVGVRRSAVIEHENGVEAVLELWPDAEDAEARVQAVLADAGYELSVIAVDEIPMDPRHNSKIDRVKLRRYRAAGLQ